MNYKNKYFRINDKGFVGLIDYMGTDESIEKFARVSYANAEIRNISDRRKLIRHLINFNHNTPVEAVELVFHIRTSLFTVQQILRHRTFSFNQMSLRYSEPLDIFEENTEWREQSKSNKQGSSNKLIINDDFNNKEKELNKQCLDFYNELIDGGVSREQARKVLPSSLYTQLYFKADLHNLLKFLKLRLDSHAQQEIREIAEIISGFVKELFPITWEAFVDYQLNSMSFSLPEQEVINEFYKSKMMDSDFFDYGPISSDDINRFNHRLSKREIIDLINKWNSFENSPSIKDYSLDMSKEITI